MPRLKRRASVLCIALLCLIARSFAGGPRWVSGRPYFSNSDGKYVLWASSPAYYTDPGDLSLYVDHAAADALVADAASTWNISVSSIVMAQGGTLNEHVSSANTYLGASGPVFPADVQAANGSAKPIAVIYDSDGSVTDLLLGSGASDPENCRQAAVTESVDSIAPSNLILHALLILNGRCTGSDPELQLEMKYRLIRAFGRVLGLAWSQTNDNVFTGTPLPSNAQGLNWPLMHPIDILCGPYAYQCLQQPFTLRTDDMASMVALYPSTVTSGDKVPAYSLGAYVGGNMQFSNGQGMQGVNVLVRRYHPLPNITDTFDVESSVSGYRFQRTGGNPVTPKGTSLAESFGWPTQDEGIFEMAWIPVPSPEPWDNMILTTEPVNPLYTGAYAVDPYTNSQVTPSGGSLTLTATVVGRGSFLSKTLIATSGAGPCTSAADGTETAPTDVIPSGEWSGTLCGYGHTAWSGLTVQAGRTFTVEVMARDEQGLPTTGKTLPVIGVWAATDAPGTLPTLGSVAFPLNTASLGLTAVTIPNTATRRLRLGLGDIRGDGRPDYAYTARILYADAISPASVALNGGQITLSGMGFRPGNTVTVNGVPAQVLSWAPTMIVAAAPAMASSVLADIVVSDLSTGGQTTMTAALQYGAAALPDILSITSAPADGAYAGVPASAGFGVRVLLADGTTPAANVGVTLSAINATFTACSGNPGCVLTTDATGSILTPVTPVAIGHVTLHAAVDTASVIASFNTAATLPDRLQVISQPSGTVYASVPAIAPFAARVFLADGLTPVPGLPVALSATNATFAACAGAANCTLTSDAGGLISTTVTPTSPGIVQLQASSGGGAASASFAALSLPPDILRITSLPASGSYAGVPSTSPFSVQVLLGDGINPAASAIVTLTTSQGTLGVCGLPSCTVSADPNGTVSTTVTPAAPGLVALSASAGGGTLLASFTAQPIPPDTLRLVSIPANGTTLGTASTTPFAFQILLPGGTTPVPGVQATVIATGGTLSACGQAACTLVSDAQGTISTTVTPALLGTISLRATAGEGSIAVSFTSAADQIRILAQPTTLVYAGVPAATTFRAQVLLANGVTPAAGVQVTITSTLSTLDACSGASFCTLTTDSTGTISTVINPNTAGIVTLQLASGGGTATASFVVLAMPPDFLRILSAPQGSAYATIPLPTPFTVQVLLGDRIHIAAGVEVRLQSPLASLGTCGQSCFVNADAQGIVTYPVFPLAPGLAVTTATAGGISVVNTFTILPLPPDLLSIVTLPPDGTIVGQGAPFSVKVLYGDGVTVASGAAVTITATNAILSECGRASCVVHANSSGVATTTVTPTAAGRIVLTATAGTTTISPSFLAVQPPDVLNVTSLPANGSLIGQPAGTPFGVRVLLPNGSAATGASVTLSAINASFGACGGVTCVVTANASGVVTSTVTPTANGPVQLTAQAGGGTVSVTFNAGLASIPLTLHVLSVPANGAYAGVVAPTPFAVQAMRSDGTGPFAGAIFTLAALNATLSACGLPVCVVTADASGAVLTSVTPTQPGTVTLAASANGSVATATFRAAVLPSDVLQITSVPASGSPTGTASATPFVLRVFLGDGATPAAGASVILNSSSALFAPCAASPCLVIADASGRVSSAITPLTSGVVTLTASAGGGSASASFSTAPAPDKLFILSLPTEGSYVGRPSALPFRVQVLHADSITSEPGAVVSMTASGATLPACGLSACLLIADASGIVSSTVVPSHAGTVMLTASSHGGSVSATFSAVDQPPDIVRVVSVPAGPAYTGMPAGGRFAVQVQLSDGSIASGLPVTFSSSAATFAGCGASPCTVLTDATGVAASIVTPTAAGPVTLRADAGGGSATASFTSVATVRTIVPGRSITYLAPGTVAAWTSAVTVSEDGLPSVGTAVGWQGTPAFQLSAPQSITGTDGVATIGVLAGPLALGETATGQACAFLTLCATFTVRTADPAGWHLQLAGGGASTTASSALQPVTLRVVDSTGNPVTGAAVTVRQVLDAWVTCPATGRCPIATILGSSSRTLVTDPDGLVTATPLELAGLPSITHFAAAAGTNAFLAIDLQKAP